MHARMKNVCVLLQIQERAVGQKPGTVEGAKGYESYFAAKNMKYKNNKKHSDNQHTLEASQAWHLTGRRSPMMVTPPSVPFGG